MANCTLYIDEAGDLGIQRGSDWFVLAGVLINKSDEPHIREVIKAIKSKININEIHLRKMQSFDKKLMLLPNFPSATLNMSLLLSIQIS